MYLSLLTGTLSMMYALAIMAKHKKTKEQKVIADLRRKLSYQLADQHSYSSSEIPKILSAKPVPIVHTGELYTHVYMKHDLLKTLLITLALVSIELILFIAMQKHVFAAGL